MIELLDPVDPGKSGNTKQISPSKGWCFTLNNPTFDEKQYIRSKIREYCDIGFYSKEIGESGTIHLQGYLKFKTKRRPLSIIDCNRIHWEKQKGSLQQNIEYCQKDTPLELRHGLPRLPHIMRLCDFNEKQRLIVNYVTNGEPDDRIIVVCHGNYGTGKTAIAKYLMYHHNAVILPTTKRHMLALASQYLERDIFMFDLSAEESEDLKTEFFEGLECIKNGIFSSAFMKFTTPCLMASPHIVVFSNTDSDEWVTMMDKARFLNIKLPEGEDKFDNKKEVSIKFV